MTVLLAIAFCTTSEYHYGEEEKYHLSFFMEIALALQIPKGILETPGIYGLHLKNCWIKFSVIMALTFPLSPVVRRIRQLLPAPFPTVVSAEVRNH